MSASRELTAALVSASTGTYFQFVIFAEMEFDAGDIFVHNGIGPLTWSGDTYLGVGDFGAVSIIEEGPEVSPYAVGVALSGIDPTLQNTSLNLNYYMRPITLSIGAIDGTGALADVPDELWSGFMDTMTVATGDKEVIHLTCESDLAIFDQANGERFSDTQLQTDFPGDLFFELLDQVEDSKLVWGAAGVAIATGAPGRTHIDSTEQR